ncbi:VOC family protein [Glutamicibacter ardleyensis]|uniref:VOC family protein n=1 Tax=Glutamicibacter ardleyensis TaxID=225894 RepID=UPI003FB9FE84
MVALISHTTFDSLNALSQSVFRGKVLDFHEDPQDPNRVGDEECMIYSADGKQRLLFIQVPDTKQLKNRMHLDLKPAQGTRD